MNKFIHKILPFTLILTAYLLILASSLAIIFEKIYENKAYPRVSVANINVSGMTESEIEQLFKNKSPLEKSKHLIFNYEGKEWATNTEKLKLKFDAKKMAHLAVSEGKGIKFFARLNFFSKVNNIEPIYVTSKKEIKSFIDEIKKEVNVAPVDALFNFDGERVSAFQFSKVGKKVDEEKIKKDIWDGIFSKKNVSKFSVLTTEVNPKIGNNDANKLGIKELIGSGVSYFYDSIPSRVYNIELASSKFNGVLIKPDETFSFLKVVGKITKLEGYKEAYVIVSGKTVLGDGGGVCQVSTTMYRAALYSGLPIIERTAHSYRVGYYEPPVGFDATIYQPGGPDLKFKNDTGHHILIQTVFDPENMSLTFNFYGTSDGRIAQISDPVIVSQTAAPPTKYQDDPNLPKGTEKQIDTAHPGAKVYFVRKVLRNNEILINEKIWSSYVPWSAVILRGTKE